MIQIAQLKKVHAIIDVNAKPTSFFFFHFQQHILGTL